MYGATENGHHHFCLAYDLSTARTRPYRLKSFFLPNVNPESAERFCSIVLDQNKTKAEMRIEIAKWAKDQGTMVAKTYGRWLRKREQARQTIALKRKMLIDKLSDEAKTVNERIESILLNQNITPDEETLMVWSKPLAAYHL
ncbi:unnamed protein product [Toxocara canis]|uniref:DUF148 domain-containing protein n=1 Tax=Toxocara canis TaxID=6265 RepID=A0A183UUM4_TOXCA|nr:unnamed protein product [Toxocara canis]